MTGILPTEVVQHFTNQSISEVCPLEDGHINHTFLVKGDHEEIVIQAINTEVFKQPEHVMENIRRTAAHLAETDYPFQILLPIQGDSNSDLLKFNHRYYRAFPFIKDSRVINTAPSPEEARTAARAFGIFASHLMNYNANQLHHTIRGFHDFEGRVQSLINASKIKNERSAAAVVEIEKTLSYTSLVTTLSVYQHRLPYRVLHSDPKINNILFDASGRDVKCVIDLDTIMPGPIFYDLSDMIRSYANLADEDEADLTKVIVSEKNLDAVLNGYLGELKGQLTGIEWESITDGYLLATYIQAVRFLTDYLNNDVYYQTGYEEHNLVRTRNQIHLLEDLIQLRPEVLSTISRLRKS